MRTNPSKRVLNRKVEGHRQKRILEVTHKLAIILALISTFFFFFKILFL